MNYILESADLHLKIRFEEAYTHDYIHSEVPVLLRNEVWRDIFIQGTVGSGDGPLFQIFHEIGSSK